MSGDKFHEGAVVAEVRFRDSMTTDQARAVRAHFSLEDRVSDLEEIVHAALVGEGPGGGELEACHQRFVERIRQRRAR